MGIASHIRALRLRIDDEKEEAPCSSAPTAGKSGIYPQKLFSERLYSEIRRSERSKRPFLLLTVGAVIREGGDQDAQRGAIEALGVELKGLLRETDAIGWRDNGLTIGAILTEIGGDVKSSMDMIKAKLEKLGVPEQGSSWADIRAFPGPPGEFEQLSIMPQSNGKSSALKRVMDVCGGIAGLVIFSPLFIVIPALIKATSSGPVLYTQTRLGQNGRHFKFLKFRSMRSDSGAEVHRAYVEALIKRGDAATDGSKAVNKMTDDPRVTPLGRLLRRSSLDELPQFINVLKGEMSLVGPRPPIPYEVESYDLWHKRRLLDAKPGLTGVWQVRARSSASFNEMVRMDLWYLKNRSLWLDLKLIFLTPWSMISSKGAY